MFIWARNMDSSRLDVAVHSRKVCLGLVFMLFSFMGDVTSGCDPLWYEYGGHCYRMLWQTTPIEGAVPAARALCRQHGADLATLKSQEELDFVAGLFTLDGMTASEVYIGLSDAEVEGEHQWLDLTPLDFIQWRNNEPNNDLMFPGGEQCASMKWTSSGFVWLDVPCLINPRDIMVAACEQPGATHSAGSFFRVVRGHVLVGHTFGSRRASSALLCAAACVASVAPCFSADYVAQDQVSGDNCFLNNATRLETREGFTSDSAVAGFDPSDWDYLETLTLEY